MIDYQQFKKKLLSNSLVVEEYEKYRSEFDVARALIQARQDAKMTQEEVARKMLTSQTQVARMESGQHMPSLQSIYKYAHAVNQTIKLAIKP